MPKTNPLSQGAVPAFDLPEVKVAHHAGLFGDFPEVVGAHIETLRQNPNPTSKIKADFFQNLCDTVDHDRFRALQREFVRKDRYEQGKDSNYVQFVKYIDPIVWFDSKLNAALRLRLDVDTRLSILDIGTGPGHFPKVAAFFGHEVLGTELPRVLEGSSMATEMYLALCDLYEVKRIPLAITEFAPLPDFGTRFDIVTAFLNAFSVSANKQPWDISAWDHFLVDLDANVLNPRGRLFMSLALGKITEVVWQHLTSMASFANERSRQLEFSDLSVLRR